jgi:hypothetical protein
MQRQQLKSPSVRPTGFRRLLKIVLWMVLMAIVVAWIAALAYPAAIKLGLEESTAARLPNFGLVVGAALGLAICLSRSLKHFLTSLFLIFVVAAVFWFFGVKLEGVLIAMGVPEHIAVWLSPAAFCFGLLLAGFAFSVEFYENFVDFSSWKRKKRTGSQQGGAMDE